MRRIVKGPEPLSLTDWKTNHPNSNYGSLTTVRGTAVRKDIREACLFEQKYLCAYCCDRIDMANSHNEHIIPQNLAPQSTLEFNNIVASCESNRHCGHKKAHNELHLSPLLPQCETEVRYYITGKMSHHTPRGQQCHTILGLRDASLTSKRKQLTEALIFNFGSDPDDVSLLDDEFLELFINELNTPDADQKLEAFAPVLVCILKEFLSP